MRRGILLLLAVPLATGAAMAQQTAAPGSAWQQAGVFSCTAQECTVTCAEKTYQRVKSAELIQAGAGGQTVLNLFDAERKVIVAVLVAGQMCHLPAMGFTPRK